MKKYINIDEEVYESCTFKPITYDKCIKIDNFLTLNTFEVDYEHYGNIFGIMFYFNKSNPDGFDKNLINFFKNLSTSLVEEIEAIELSDKLKQAKESTTKRKI